MEEELEHLSCGATTGFAIESIKPASAATTNVKSVVISLVTDGTKFAILGHSLLK